MVLLTSPHWFQMHVDGGKVLLKSSLMETATLELMEDAPI
jgi:hypothetical protein